MIPPGVTPDLWDEAHRQVWAYLAALGVSHDFLLYRLVQRVMERVARRLEQGDATAPVVIASDEVEAELTAWFRRLLDIDGEDGLEVSQRGRLALLLTNMPQRWQDLLLSDPPWPAEFVTAVRESYLRAVPEMCLGRMECPPLDLGTLSRLADAALRGLDRRLWLKRILPWALLAMLVTALYFMTR